MKMQDALNRMATDIRERKDARAVALTPVGIEPGGPLAGKHPLPFPYDDPQTIRVAIRNGLDLVSKAKVELDHVGRGLIELASLYGLDTEEPAVTAPAEQARVEQVARERLADEQAQFDAGYAEKQRRAQADAFDAEKVARAAQAIFEPKAVVVETGWSCPVHEFAMLVDLTSRKGRKYRACKAAGCSEFEREG